MAGPAPYDGNADDDGDGVKNDQDLDPNDPQVGHFLLAKNLGQSKGACETRPMAGNPINFATGNKFQREIDLDLSGPGLPS